MAAREPAPGTKLAGLVAHMRAGEWPQALAVAARFQDLGGHRRAILRAHESRWNPEFFRQLGRDPDELYQEGVDALRDRYSDYL